MPAWEVDAAAGADCVATLTRAGVLHEAAIRAGESVPCAECRSPARVIWEHDQAVAVCTGDTECPVELLGAAPCRLVLDPVDLSQRIASAFELEGTPGAGELVVPLGRRWFGEELVAVDLCPHPGRVGVEDAIFRVARGGPRVRVMLAPYSGRIRADVATELGGADIVWAGLDQVLVIEEDLRADLRPILAQRTFAGFELPRLFDGLEIDAAGVRWQGRAVLPPANARAVSLLRLLAERPGQFVPRRELWRGLWPDEHTREGGIPRGTNPDKFENRLRVVVAEVRDALEAAGGEALRARLTNQRSSEATGGYRLDLEPGRVRVR